MCDLRCSAEPVQKLAFLAEQFSQPECLEQSSSKMRRYQSRKALQLRGNRENQKEEITTKTQRNKSELNIQAIGVSGYQVVGIRLSGNQGVGYQGIRVSGNS